MNKVKVFQIYFDKEQIKELDPNFIPFDNTDNARPDLREYYIWNKIHNSDLVADVDYWGALSWQYGRKTNFSGQHLINTVTSKPGFDVYYRCPFSFHGNVWVQGDMWHSNISQIADSILQKLGFSVNCRNLTMSASFFCNFFVARKSFWTEYMKFISNIFDLCASDEYLNEKVFGLSLQHNQKPLGMFPFLIERFTPTFIHLAGASSTSC